MNWSMVCPRPLGLLDGIHERLVALAEFPQLGQDHRRRIAGDHLVDAGVWAAFATVSG